MAYVTWHDLLDIATFLVAVVALAYKIYRNKRK